MPCPCHQSAPVSAAGSRGTARERGYGTLWAKASRAFRSAHPLCAQCQRDGRLVQGGCVDHVIPHRGDQRLFWDRANWQTLCLACHSSKTAREDGGLGLIRTVGGSAEGEGECPNI